MITPMNIFTDANWKLVDILKYIQNGFSTDDKNKKLTQNE